jgi:rhodanese-related sulfurtransferase/DNA-binding HxlR family transcriptional regulator
MADRAAKDALFDTFAEVGRALGSGRRLEILDVLAQGERSVEEIAGELDQSVANTSAHLRALARSGLVITRRSGTRVYYRLAGEAVEFLWAAVREVATTHVAGLDRAAADYLGGRDQLEVVSRQDVARLLGRRRLVLLDVRPPAEFQAGHLPGARSVPPQELRSRLRAVDAESEVIAYCRGPYCAYADEAVRLLRRRGVRARRLEDGFPEWRRAGLPVAVGDEG